MSLSKWYADVILPGKKASSFVQGATFSSNFDWDAEKSVDKITYFLSCDSTAPVENPKIGVTTDVVISGYKNVVLSESGVVDIVGAIKKDSDFISSSSSISSESLSSSSESSSHSFNPLSSSCSMSSISSSSSGSS